MSDHVHLPLSGITVPLAEGSPPLAELVEAGLLSLEELAEAMRQVEFFMARRHAIQDRYPGQYIFICEQEVFPGQTYEEARDLCRRYTSSPYFAAGFMPVNVRADIQAPQGVIA